MPQNLQEFITFLKTNGFRAECPQYSGKIDISKAPFFIAEYFTPEAKELLKQRKDLSKERKLELNNRAHKFHLIIKYINRECKLHI